ncbi:carbohydrate esterase family 5 protein [Zasmidium cellare ATCC 36951]|uniref:Cutinase n=1 Tax=Zasmidium cellare ATCC 36951 TaxID=1080233 RepID=A0A6A6D350_ZASCE|nr:carbohydrate esterase family 5 protein [Zasmidium cellare ATCC 36951]KAF2172868.1 carbohydrate esterase family 5 protein [Zasmidium cellare ATCC 36951]
MKVTTQNLLLSLAASALAAPVDNQKRQLGGGSGSLPSISGISLPSLSGVALPTGGAGGSSGGLGGLGGSSGGGLGGLGGSSGGLGGSTGGLGGSSGSIPGLGSSGGLGSSTGDLSGLGGSGSGLDIPSKTLKKRQSLGALTTGLPSGSGGLGSGSGSIPGLGGSSSGSGSIPSLGGSSGSGSIPSLGGSSGSGSIPGLGGSSSSGSIPGLGSGSSGLGGLGSGSSSSSGGDLSSLGGLSSGSSLTPSTTLKERQDLGSFSGFGSSASGLSGLGGLTGSTGSTGSTDSSSAADGGCKALTLIFARGTGEMGTMGSVIGPPLASALESALGADKVSSQGVDYPADAGGNANMGASGGPAMASQAQEVFSSCPDSKVVLSGYSQGAMVVHNALSSQGLDGSKVAAVVAFGDPLNGQEFEGVDAAKTKEFCGSGDFLCSAGGTTGSGSHLSYTADADAAAQFIVQAVGL